MKLFRLTAESTHYNNDVAINIGFALRLRWLFLMALTLLLILAWWLTNDPPLSLEAREWMQETVSTDAKEHEAFAYLVGFDVPADKDVTETGFERLNAAIVATNQSLDGDRIDQPPSDQSGDTLYCSIRESNCLSNVVRQSIRLGVELKKHSILLERFDKFLGFELLTVIRNSSIKSLNLPLDTLQAAAMMSRFRTIQFATTGQFQRAGSTLSRNIAALRNLMAGADVMPLKMSLAAILVDELDLTAGLFARNLIPSLITPDEASSATSSTESAFSPLAPREFSMIGPVQSEFAQFVEIIETIKSDPESLGLEERLQGFTGFVSRKSIRENHIVNQIYAKYRMLLVSASLPTIIVDDEFVKRSGVAAEVETGILDLTEIVPTALKNVERLDIVPYVFQLRDLDSKLKLLRIRMSGSPQIADDYIDSLSDAVDLSNPYDPYKQVEYSRETGQLCFDGPRPDEIHARCISVY